MDELIRLLTEFGADAALIDLATRFGQTEGDPLTDVELDTLLSGLVALAEDDEASAALLSEAVGCARTVREQIAARTAQAEAEEAERAAAVAELRGEGDDEQGDEAADGEGADGEGDAGGDDGDEGGDGDGGAGDGADGEQARESVTAGGTATMQRTARRALARRTSSAAQAPEADDGRIRIVFAAGVPERTRGERAESFGDVDRSLVDTWETFAGQGGSGDGFEKVRVARVFANYPAERMLIDAQGRPVTPDIAAQRVEAVLTDVLGSRTARQALVAAGGLCAPLTPYYGVDVLGDDRRPIRDQALVSFQATRGGLISVAPPRLTDLTGAIGIWTLDDDVSALDGTPTKPILRVDCGEQRTTRIYAVTARLEYGNILSRTFAEWTSAFADLSMIAHARIAEVRLLSQIKALSTNVSTQTTTVSATRDLLDLLDRAAFGFRSRHRVPRDYPFRCILPEITLGLMRTDIARGLVGGAGVQSNLTLAQAQIDEWFRVRNINVTYSPDMEVVGEQAAGTPIPDWPSSIEWALYPEGTFLFLDAGTLDLGVVRDSGLDATNDFQTFVETFEGVHMLGIEALWGRINLCPSGAVNGTLDPAPMCAAYT